MRVLLVLSLLYLMTSRRDPPKKGPLRFADAQLADAGVLCLSLNLALNLILENFRLLHPHCLAWITVEKGPAGEKDCFIASHNLPHSMLFYHTCNSDTVDVAALGYTNSLNDLPAYRNASDACTIPYRHTSYQ